MNVKVTAIGRTENTTKTFEGEIDALPSIKKSLVVKSEGQTIFESDPVDVVTHHVKDNAYTLKIGRHKVRVEVK